MDERSNSRASDIIHQMVSYEHDGIKQGQILGSNSSDTQVSRAKL